MKKNKWRELYDSYSEEFRATLSWDEFMMMPEAMRENLTPLTAEEMEKEYPDRPFDRENCDVEDEEFSELCKKQSDVLNKFKEAYDKLPKWFRDYMSLGDLLATPEPYRTNIAESSERELIDEFRDVYWDSLDDGKNGNE